MCNESSLSPLHVGPFQTVKAMWRGYLSATVAAGNGFNIKVEETF